MQILSLQQGTPDWHAARAQHFTASEAPAMMGASKYLSRSELLRQKATGLMPEVSIAQQQLFHRGHAAEAAARPLAEKLINDELYPATAVDDDGYLLASFDGITMLEDTILEHKLWSETLAAQVRNQDLEPHYYWQLEQQLYVSGAERVIFVVSDGTEENFVWMEYRPVEGRAEQLLAGWKQFEKDLAEYQPEPAKAEVVGRAPENLPALHIEVQGMVKASNLEQFKEHALAVFSGINTELQTDEDFANAESTVKWCREVETRLDAAKDHALSQTESIDELFRAIDSIREEARAKRLELDKLVKARKQAIRGEILQDAKDALGAHVAAISETFPLGLVLPSPDCDFAAAMKGKKTVKSLRDAADQELARAKIEANQAADGIRANLKTLDELAPEHGFLFSDLQQIVTKPGEDFAAVIKTRIAEHQAAEEKRLAAERERIRQEEQTKLAKEAVKPAEPVKQAETKPPANPPGEEPLTQYERGFIDGLREYAHWKDGVQYVGTAGTTLDEAIDRFLQRKAA